MGCFLSKEQLMVASIRKSDTKKAQVALRMGVRLNGALNVRVAQPATWPWPCCYARSNPVAVSPAASLTASRCCTALP